MYSKNVTSAIDGCRPGQSEILSFVAQVVSHAGIDAVGAANSHFSDHTACLATKAKYKSRVGVAIYWLADSLFIDILRMRIIKFLNGLNTCTKCYLWNSSG